jgi:hypothetical protein
MGDSKYVPIDVPDMGEEGLTQFQRDHLQLESVRTLNFFGLEIDEHSKEIYGHKKYRGMKAKSHETPCPEVRKLSRRLWWLITTLVTAGLVGGGAVSLSQGIGG